MPRNTHDDWRERSTVYDRLPGLVDDPLRAIRLLDRLRRRTRNGNDLFFLERTAVKIGEKWSKARRDVERFLERMYDHIPPPEEALFRQIETPIDGMVDLWRPVASGEFLMGSPLTEEGRLDSEAPQHRVRITSPFLLAAVPVTLGQYAAFDPWYEEEIAAAGDLATFPLENITWYEAYAFCRWLGSSLPCARGARLPTEEEWEYACRAGTQTRYWSGDLKSDLDRVGWYHANSEGYAHPVGEKQANPWGLYDVHGNVLEWTLSTWRPDYSGRDTGIAIDPAAIEAMDLALRKGKRVSRGGGYWYRASGSRSACRIAGYPGDETSNQGFRVLLPTAGDR